MIITMAVMALLTDYCGNDYKCIEAYEKCIESHAIEMGITRPKLRPNLFRLCIEEKETDNVAFAEAYESR